VTQARQAWPRRMQFYVDQYSTMRLGASKSRRSSGAKKHNLVRGAYNIIGIYIIFEYWIFFVIFNDPIFQN